MNSLKEQAINGFLWSFVERFGTQFIILISQIILARILLPEDFGLIGMLAIFIAISQVFVDSGFGTALIQKKEATDVDFSTIFYFNLIVAIFLYLCLFISSPKIAFFLINLS